VRREASGFHARMPGSGFFHKAPVETLALLWRCARRKARPRAAVGIGHQGELRYDEKAAARILDRKIYLARAVRKHAVAEHALGEARGFRFAVVALDAEENEKPGTDRAHGFASDGDARLGDPLDQRDHAMMSGMSLARRRWI